MYRTTTVFTVAAICALMIVATCRPQQREKRSGISDQRLAELETLLALSKMKGNKGNTKTVAYGIIDPMRIGKRKRSYSSDLLEELRNQFRLRLMRSDPLLTKIDASSSSETEQRNPITRVEAASSHNRRQLQAETDYTPNRRIDPLQLILQSTENSQP